MQKLFEHVYNEAFFGKKELDPDAAKIKAAKKEEWASIMRQTKIDHDYEKGLREFSDKFKKAGLTLIPEMLNYADVPVERRSAAEEYVLSKKIGGATISYDYDFDGVLDAIELDITTNEFIYSIIFNKMRVRKLSKRLITPEINKRPPAFESGEKDKIIDICTELKKYLSSLM